MSHLDLLLLKLHTRNRMAQRGITVRDILSVLEANDVIEDYPNTRPYPCRLLFGNVNGRVLHVVSALHGGVERIITVYEPNTETFEADLRTRKLKGRE